MSYTAGIENILTTPNMETTKPVDLSELLPNATAYMNHCEYDEIVRSSRLVSIDRFANGVFKIVYGEKDNPEITKTDFVIFINNDQELPPPMGSFPEETPQPPEMVNHPKHYNNNPSGVECIDVIEYMSLNTGVAMKYIWRHLDKGNPIQDLEKAIWYLNREISRLKKEKEQSQ